MGLGIGGFVSSLFGSENKDKAQAPQVDPSAYQYGGHAGGAAEAADRYARTSNDYNAQARYATDQAYGDRGNAAGARQEQANALGLMRMRATGQTPSIAGMQAQRDMQAMQAQQASAAASARGPAALALAQQNAAANTATAAGNISQNAQIAAAQERLAAEQAYMGGASGMRQQDYAGAQQAAGMSGQFQNSAMGYSQLEKGVQDSAMAARMNQQAQQSANALGAAGINAGVGGQNAAMNQQNAYGVVGIGRDAAGLAFPGKADGGPVTPGQPYVMGERGPELVVPAKNPMSFMGVGGPMGASSMNPMGSPTGTTVLGAGGGMDVMGSLKANSDFGTRFIGNPGASPMARADGGPVAGGQPYLVGERGPEIVVPQQAGVVIPHEQTRQIVPSTWGTGAAAKEQQAAADLMDTQAETTRPSAVDRRNDAKLAAYQRYRATGIGLDPDEQREERRILAMKGIDAKEKTAAAQEAKAQVAQEQGKAQPQRERFGIVDRIAGGVDTKYHAMGGYVPPQLIPVAGAREGGGPMDAGKGYLVGERGPEMVLPLTDLPGKQLHYDAAGRGTYVAEPVDVTTGPSLSGPVPQYGVARMSMADEAKAKAKAAAAARQPSLDEIAAWAKKEEADTREKTAASKGVSAVAGDPRKLDAALLWAQDEQDRLRAGMAAPTAVEPALARMRLSY